MARGGRYRYVVSVNHFPIGGHVAKKREVMIRVDPDEWEELRGVARDEDVSMAEYIRRLLTRSLAQKRG